MSQIHISSGVSLVYERERERWIRTDKRLDREVYTLKCHALASGGVE